jgi:hypothetical protein
MNEKGVRLLRLEFPRTEIQLFGDTAILYYTYIFETGLNDKSVVDGGHGIEIFVRRDGKWVDVGWHLDHGPFLTSTEIGPDLARRCRRQARQRLDDLIEYFVGFWSLTRCSNVTSITWKSQ